MKITLSLLIIFLSWTALARTVAYQINVGYETVNVTGTNVRAMALGNVGEPLSIPAPTLEFTEGDTAQITFYNNLDVETSVHWHGLLVPNDQDGVPGLTTPPIKPHSHFTYQFSLKQSGTYWYHSHSNLQQQRGIYGAIVIHPRQEILKYDVDQTIVLSDWTNRNPEQILNNLKTDEDIEQILKNTHRGWIQDFKEGTIHKRLQSEKTRMGPMDIADVYYDAFLVNGRRSSTLNDIFPGQRVRLRLINAGSSSYFQMAFGKQTMEVVAADGNNVEPVKVSDLQIAMGETYDVIVTVPSDKSVELRATSVDGTGYGSVIFGRGPLEQAPKLDKPDPYAMSMPRGHGHSSGTSCNPHQHLDPTQNACVANNCKPDQTWDDGMQMCMPPHDDDAAPLIYNMLKALSVTTLPNAPVKELEFDLTGNMFNYVWSINNKVFGDAETIQIQKGTRVRIKFVNDTMMHHPLHLHGHFFRVLNGQNEFSPLKHTVDIPPMETITIEFFADKDGDWLFHCHNLDHGVTGMARDFHVGDHVMLPDAPMTKMKDMSGTRWYRASEAALTDVRAEAEFRAMNYKFNLLVMGEYNYSGTDSEVRAEASKNLSQNFKGGAGFEQDNKGSAGRAFVQYRFPYLINGTLGAGNRGVDFTIAKEFALTNHLSFDTKYGREYGLTKYNAFLKWRRYRALTVKAGPSEQSKFEFGVDFRK